MKEMKTSGQDLTDEVKEAINKVFTKKYESTMMISPITGKELVIRECFDRWQLEDDGETEEEHKMRKKLLNAFKKASKKRGRKLIKGEDDGEGK